MPSFSSTRSLIRETCRKHHVKSRGVEPWKDGWGHGGASEMVGGAHFVIWLNVQLDLLPGQGTDSVKRSDPRVDRFAMGSWAYLINIFDED